MLATLIFSSSLIPFSGDYLMQIYRALIVFCFCAMLCHAQATKTDQALLNPVSVSALAIYHQLV
jgi:hypothetical protein